MDSVSNSKFPSPKKLSLYESTRGLGFSILSNIWANEIRNVDQPHNGVKASRFRSWALLSRFKWAYLFRFCHLSPHALLPKDSVVCVLKFNRRSSEKKKKKKKFDRSQKKKKKVVTCPNIF